MHARHRPGLQDFCDRLHGGVAKLLVRHDAIKKEDERLGVYVPRQVQGKPDPEPQFVPCRFGLDNGSYAEVIEGELKEGDKVYVKLPRPAGEEKK